MKHLARRLVLSALIVCAPLAAPALANAVPPHNDDYGSRSTVPPWGGTENSSFAHDATESTSEREYDSVLGTYAWTMWYAWTAPISGTVRLDLCQTNPAGDPWYIIATRAVEFMSPFAYPLKATTGCANAAMPQGDFTADAGTEYQIAVGAKHAQPGLVQLRATYLPQVASAPTITGSAAVGQTLHANAPTWKTHADQHTLTGPTWVRCAADGTSCTPLSLKLGGDYVLQPADAGAQVHAEFTATNAAGAVTTQSAPTATIAAKPADSDGDGIPDELVTALNIPPGAAGLAALCTQYSLCKDDSHQSPIFANWNAMTVIDGKLLDVLLGSIKPELLIANPAAPASESSTKCDGGAGNDVCVGNKNADSCIAYIGDDFCLGNRGNDTCVSKAGNDVCYGGEGADACFMRPAAVAGIPFPPVPKATCLGGPGQDSCVVNIGPVPVINGAWLPSMTCEGGTANDTCKAAAVKLVNGLKLKKAGVLRMKCAGDAGNDTCGITKSIPSKLSSLLKAVCSGGTGKDLCIAKGAASLAAGIFGAQNSVMTCNGGPGADTLWTLNGKGGDRITGGGQAGDFCVADWGDIVSGCGTSLRIDIPTGQIGAMDGSAAELDALAKSATVTRNGQQMTDEQIAQLLAQINDMTTKLNAIQLSSTESIRNVLQSIA